MVGFLREVAQNLVARKGNAIAQCHLVFPSQRAKTAFFGELGSLLESPLWKPHSLGMDELIDSISALKIPSRIELLALLYQSYTELMNFHEKPAESFDQFYSWGEIILADFDAIDKQNLDAETVFSNIEDLKSIDELFHSREIDEQVKAFWKITSEKPNEAFLQTWKILYPLYAAFQEKLLLKGYAYSGMQYKTASQHLESLDSTHPYVFIGFNALNPCEKIIFDHLQHQDALFYWDCDAYYLQQEHEAGFFMRENLHRYGNALSEIPDRIRKQRDIHIYAAESDIMQCKLAGTLAQGKTAMVLVNEHLLMPCMHSIPLSEQTELNITMGYPFVLTATFAWIRDWIQASLGNARLELNACEHHFFTKDLLQLMEHDTIAQYIPNAEDLKRSLLQSKQRIVGMVDLFGDQVPECLSKAHNGRELISLLVHLTDQILFRMVRTPQYSAESFESHSFVYEQLKQLQTAIKNACPDLSLRMCARLILKHLNSLNMTLESDRESDLQIMGFLETRAMDFENIIILSANDDRLPGNTHQLSFIPFSLRCAYGLPTHKEKEAMYAYYFFRLLQRSRTVHLIYNNSQSGTNTGEVSRFIQQIQLELLPEPQPTSYISMQTRLLNRKPNIISKQGEEWNQFTAHPVLSASSLNDYLDCSLKFYFKHIAKIYEPPKIAQEVDGSIFGEVIHDSMRRLYAPFGNDVISKTRLQELLQDDTRIRDMLKEVCQTHGLSSDFGEGAMLERFFLAFIQRIIQYDKDKRGDFSIHSMEERREATAIEFRILGETKTVFLKAVFDRVDRETGQWVVVDYKTGRPPEKSSLSVDMTEIFSADTKKKGLKEARQTLLYSLLMQRDGHPSTKPLLYFVQKMHQPDYSAEIEFLHSDQPLEDFCAALETELNILFNPDIPFAPCQNPSVCEFCPYIRLCEPQITVYDA